MPTTSIPYCSIAARATPLMAVFSPGASPPEVRIPKRLTLDFSMYCPFGGRYFQYIKLISLGQGVIFSKKWIKKV